MFYAFIVKHSSSPQFGKYSQCCCFTVTNLTPTCISDIVGDVATVLATPTGYPFIQVFYNATRSKGGATAMTSIMIVLSTANGMTNMATASRQLFAFARDRGVPFSDWFQKVPAGWDIPLNGEYRPSVRSTLMLEMIYFEI